MKKPLAEKIGVVTMFILVLVVFSFAERDTKKMIQQQSRTVDQNNLEKNLTTAEQLIKADTILLTSN